MTEDQYNTQMDLLVSQAAMIAMLDLDTLRETIARADALSFLQVRSVDHARITRNLDDQRRLVDAAIQVQKVILDIRARAIQ